jgi:hypothetical protein
MQDELASALIDVLDYTSSALHERSLRQDASGKIASLQSTGHWRHVSNCRKTLVRLVGS